MLLSPDPTCDIHRMIELRERPTLITNLAEVEQRCRLKTEDQMEVGEEPVTILVDPRSEVVEEERSQMVEHRGDLVVVVELLLVMHTIVDSIGHNCFR